MDQPPSKPTFADDPDFLASLADLDSGLIEGEEKARPPSRTVPAPRTFARHASPNDRSDLSVDLGEFEFPAAAAPPPTAPPPPIAPRLAIPSPPQPIVAQPAAARPRIPAVVLPEIVPPPPGGRRPLLDLFPPPPGGTGEPPDLAIGIAPPPSITARARPHSAPAAAAPPATYEPFYGLAEKPFTLSTDPKFLYHSTAHDAAAQDLLSAIRRRDGLVVLTGEIGVGKTTLCRAVSEELDRRTLTSIVLDPFVSVEALLQTVLVDFGVISRDDVARGLLAQTSGAELFGKLREFLASLVQLDAFAVVIIDEAQNLPAPVLEEIRALMDLDAQQRLLQIALVGQPSLLKLLARRELRKLQQRVAVRSELKALAADEIAGYVMHRLSVARMQARVEFDDPALARLYRMSAGVPRVVNLVCDRALTLGYQASARVIDETLILTAARDLDVVPPAPRSRQLLRTALIAVVLIALMGVGAAAAASVFRAPLSRIIAQWSRVPPPPAPPLQRLPPALAPLPPPAENLTAPPAPHR